jgi:riboflavin kinase / FMN adenylyltransferase
MRRLTLAGLSGTLAPNVLTLGNFDGVHRGHQLLVAEALAKGGEAGLPVVVATFDPHPARVLEPERAPQTLMTLSQKADALDALGVDALVSIGFDREMAALSAGDFARAILVGRLGARLVVVGPGFRFGHARGGDVALLRQLGEELGFGVAEVAPLVDGGRAVSSTRVREAVALGDVGMARALLGRSFANEGVVVAGDGRGRAIGVPTANLAPENEAIPANGVYAAWCRLRSGQGTWSSSWPAAVNIGTRPTFAGKERRVEAHLLGFSENAYGRSMRIEYWRRLRAEKVFADAAGLVAQVGVDIQSARETLTGSEP